MVVYEEDEKYLKGFGGKPNGKKPLENFRRKYGNSIKILNN
jgi:hypothetical protein